MSTDQLIARIKQMPQNEVQALTEILDEYEIAKERHPVWPDDVIHQAAIVSEESGELVRAANMCAMEGAPMYSDMLQEATQTAAMGFRFLVTNS
jgi:hypothetical protein